MRKTLIPLLCALLSFTAAAKAFAEHRGEEYGGRVVFDYVFGEEGNKACIRLPRGGKEVKAVLYAHQNMTEEVLFRSRLFCERMDSLGVAMAFIQRGSQNWDVSRGCQERFERIMKSFAEGTQHPEIESAPIIPFGHSAQATFPWNFAAWNPERTLCIISFHGDAPRTNLTGYGRDNIEWGRTRNIDSIAGLMIMGEYEWWDARLRPALAFRMMYPDSRISFLCDAGKGHFDLCEQTMNHIADFISESLDDPRPRGGIYRYRSITDGKETDNPHEQFWYHGEQTADAAQRRVEESFGKKMQYLAAKIDGRPIPYLPDRHITMSLTLERREFELEPIFVDAARNAETTAHADVRPRITIISGPVIQTGEYTFEYDPDYFGYDPERLWSGITLCIEADGDDEYKSAVQELNIHLINTDN